MHFRSAAIVVLLTLVITACPARQEGALEGTVSPPGAGIRIAVLQEGKQIAAAEAGPADGKFRIMLPAGTYEAVITSTTSPYPLRFPGIRISPKETTTLPPVVLGPAAGTASIGGTVRTGGVAARVAIVEEGKERSSVTTDPDGRYEFEGLPAGRYVLRVEAPGYAADAVSVSVANDRKAVRDIRMLYVTAIDGVDWARGTLKVRGIGLPPKQSPTPTVRREMAKLAAKADAERNLLRALELLQVGPAEKLTAAMRGGDLVQQLQGYLKGYRIAAERDLDGGRVEIELELPLTGPDGLTAMLPPS